MSLDPDLAELYVDTVSIKAAGPLGKSGKATHPGAAVDYAAKIEGRTITVTSPTGETLTSTVQIYIFGTPEIDLDDELTMPSRFDPQVPKIMAVRYPTDEDGVHHTVIYA